MNQRSDSALPRSPLHDALRSGGVAFGEVDGWEMPRVFENIKMEYLAVKGTVGIMDRSNHGRLRVSGAKRFDLLHRLTTNDLKQVAPGQGARTLLLTDKGRIIDDLHLHARDDFYYLVTSPGKAAAVRAIIEKMRFRDDVAVEEVTGATAMIGLLGPQAPHLLEAATGARNLGDLPAHHCVDLAIAGTPVLAARTRDAGGAGFSLIVESAGAAAAWSGLFAEGGPYGASPCGEEAYEMVRIESGIPRSGRELTEDFNPLEAGLGEAISWTKGCYVGQEVIARMDSRDKVTRRLVGLWLEPGPIPEAGSELGAADRDGAPIGRLTSVAPSLDFRRVIGLAYVHKDAAEPGTAVVILSDGDRVGAVTSRLPFEHPASPA